MVKLFVSIVGSDDITSVDIDGSDSIDDLKKAMAAAFQLAFPAPRLKLYLGKLDGVGWLEHDDPALKALQRPDFPRDSPYLAAEPLSPILDVGHYFPRKPRRNAVHVLAVRPNEATVSTTTVGTTRSIADVNGTALESVHPPKKAARAIDWAFASDNCPQLDYDESNNAPFLCIPERYIQKSGLKDTRPGEDLWIYRRKAVQEQWDEIERDSVQCAAVLKIYGDPGTGKSWAAFAFACGVVDRVWWDVVWIHHRRKQGRASFVCVKFEGGVKWTCEFNSPDDVDSLLETSRVVSSCELASKSEDADGLLESSFAASAFTVPSCGAQRGLFVFLDGYLNDGQSGRCTRVTDKLMAWQLDRRCHRRLVCVTSMVSAGKQYRIDELESLPMPPTVMPSRQNGKTRMLDEMLFKLSSWRLEEYREAVMDNQFFRSVMPAFDIEEVPDIDYRQKLVDEKHYVAGGSARAMFAITTEEVKTMLVKLVDAVGNVELLGNGSLGGSSEGAINRLLAHYDIGGRTEANFRSEVVSAFAMRLIAIRLGPSRILKFANLCSVNPAMDGHLFEAWVVASVQFHDLQYRYQAQPNTVNALKQCAVNVFDPTRDVIPKDDKITDLDQCYVPTKWNQAGYDAVYIRQDEENPSRPRYIFLQVTRATTHSYDAEPFRGVLNMLKEHDVEVGTIELWYVVSLDILKAFKSPVSDSSWREVVETAFLDRSRSSLRPSVKSRVRVVGVRYDRLERTARQ